MVGKPIPMNNLRKYGQSKKASYKPKKKVPVLWKSTLRNLANIVLFDKGFPASQRFPMGAPPPKNVKTPAQQVKFLDKVERVPAKRGFKKHSDKLNKDVTFPKL